LIITPDFETGLSIAVY